MTDKNPPRAAARPVPGSPAARVAAQRKALDGVLVRDFARLLGRWRRFSAAPDKAESAALERLDADIAASAARRAARAKRVPQIRIDESLPIAARADEIQELHGE